MKKFKTYQEYKDYITLMVERGARDQLKLGQFFIDEVYWKGETLEIDLRLLTEEEFNRKYK